MQFISNTLIIILLRNVKKSEYVCCMYLILCILAGFGGDFSENAPIYHFNIF